MSTAQTLKQGWRPLLNELNKLEHVHCDAVVVVSLSFGGEEQKNILYTVWYIQGQQEPRDIPRISVLFCYF